MSTDEQMKHAQKMGREVGEALGQALLAMTPAQLGMGGAEYADPICQMDEAITLIGDAETVHQNPKGETSEVIILLEKAKRRIDNSIGMLDGRIVG